MAAAFRAASARSDDSSGLSSVESSASNFMRRRGIRSSRSLHSSADTTADTTPTGLARCPTGSPEHKPAPPSRRRYRDSTEAPDSFKEQTQILLEEGLYYLAIQSLQTNLFSQSYRPLDTPWWVAPPAHIAFLGTLVIHPLHTTWASIDDTKNKKIVAVRAYQYLLDVLRSVGPVNGHFRTAFAFRDRSSRASRRRRAHTPDESDPAANREDDLTTPLADADSLWNRVPDFWTMLGWAFSCAASHPERWPHWKLWLELLLDVMERDVAERKALDDEKGDGQPRNMLRNSILASYVGEHQLGHIMRVLFAYIDGDDAHSYQEIWPRETQIPTSSAAATNKRKRDEENAKAAIVVDLERDEFGDWFEDEDDDTIFADPYINDARSTSPTPARRKGKARVAQPRSKKRQPLPLVENPLLEETIPIRRRIFALLSRLCYELPPTEAPFAVFDLYERFAEHVRDLPLDVFPRLVWSDSPEMERSVYVTLARHLLARLLPPGVPQPLDVDAETEANGYVSGAMMERCFLPWAASSVVADNARLAVVLWELLSYLWRVEESEVGPDSVAEVMRGAILAGIEARERKSKLRNEGGPAGDPDWVEEKMAVIEKDRYAPANVLRLAHLKFRLLLEKAAEREALSEGEQLGADFLGWK